MRKPGVFLLEANLRAHKMEYVVTNKKQFYNFALINNKICPLSEAVVPLGDRGFLFGHSVFETLLIQKGKIFAWDNHIKRLQAGCKKTYIPYFDKKILHAQVQKLIEHTIKYNASTPERMVLRLIVTAGTSESLTLSQNANTPNIYLFCKLLPPPDSPDVKKSISLKSFKDTRDKSLIDTKTCNYLLHYLCLTKAIEEGFDDAIFFNDENCYTEGTTFNFIWFKDEKKICSAPLEGNCLPGTTFLHLIEALSGTDYKLEWIALPQKEMTNIKGCAILSSTRLIIPVHQIDDFQFPENEEMVSKLRKILETNLLLT